MAIIEWAKVQAGTGASFGGVTVGTTAVQLGGTLSGRTSMTIFNNDAADTIYVGIGPQAAAVTSSTGFPVGPGQVFPMDLGPGILVYAVTASATADVRWTESF